MRNLRSHDNLNVIIFGWLCNQQFMSENLLVRIYSRSHGKPLILSTPTSPDFTLQLCSMLSCVGMRVYDCFFALPFPTYSCVADKPWYWPKHVLYSWWLCTTPKGCLFQKTTCYLLVAYTLFDSITTRNEAWPHSYPQIWFLVRIV